MKNNETNIESISASDSNQEENPKKSFDFSSLVNQAQNVGAAMLDNAQKAGKIASDTASYAVQLASKTYGKEAGQTTSDNSAHIDKTVTPLSNNIDITANEKKYRNDKKNLNFKNLESMQPVVNVVNEAAAALHDTNRTIQESAIPEVLAGALGAGMGGVFSFAALYGLGMVGLSAAGITSGLATAGALIGGGMAAGIFVLATPVAGLAAVSVGVASHLKNKQLKQEKERLYKEALLKHEAIIQALKTETEASKDRMDYLQSLNILLQQAIKELQSDLDINS